MNAKTTYPLATMGLASALLTAGCQNDAAPTNRQVTILPVLTISDAADVTEGSGVKSVFTVTLSEERREPVSLRYVTNSDTAFAQTDFKGFDPINYGTLIFEPGNTQKTIEIDIEDDAIHEDIEEFAVVIYAGQGADVDRAQEMGHGRIIDNDQPPVVEFDPNPDIAVPPVIVESGGGITLTLRLLDPSGSGAAAESGIDVEIPVTFAGVTADDAAFPDTITIPAGYQTYEYHLAVIDDVEQDTTFVKSLDVFLGDPLNGSATLSGTNLQISTTLQDDDGTGALNDTGVSTCYDATAALSACPASGEPFAGQDAQQAGNAFSFTATPDGCLIDDTTGLMWEVKTIDTSVRSTASLFTWYNTHGNINGGGSGSRRDAGTNSTCYGLTFCDTQAYVEAVNNLNNGQGLCGYNDWRMPKVNELLSLVHYEAGKGLPTIPADFINTQIEYHYWTATPSVSSPTMAWQVDFKTGNMIITEKGGTDLAYIRLVRTVERAP